MQYRIHRRFNTRKRIDRRRDENILDSKILYEIIRFIFRLILRGMCKGEAIQAAALKFGVSEQEIRKYL